MFMTEAEAKTQVCPHIRYIYNEIDVLQYDRAPIYVQQNCQGSACKMAWRWAQTPEFKMQAETEFRRHGRRIEPTQGYCGIAGRPEL